MVFLQLLVVLVVAVVVMEVVLVGTTNTSGGGWNLYKVSVEMVDLELLLHTKVHREERVVL